MTNKTKMIRGSLCMLMFCLLLNPVKGQEVKILEGSKPGSFNVRSNMLGWLLLVPNLGVEYRAADRIGLLADGGLSHWNFKRNGNDHYWRNWYAAPQLRYYPNELRDAYIGLKGTIGDYNISNEQGRFMGGGFTFGKQYAAGKKLMIDIGLTLGFLQFSNVEKMRHVNGEHYRTATIPDRTYWGPTGISISFSRRTN